jgi:serine/threonine protein phosphatase PrpC
MAELPTINLALYAQTDVGMVRSGNEDNFLILDLSSGRSWTASEEEPSDLLTYAQGYYGSLLAVSDGMGGALAGEVASRMAVDTVRDRMLQLQAHEVYSRLPFHERLRLSIEEANILIHGESQTNPAHKGLGATFTGVATLGSQVFFGQVGDSRAYLIRGGNIIRTTKDQSLVQQLIDAGQITEEEAETHSYRNVILQALGAHGSVNVEVGCLTLCNMDTLVICSDGLSGKVHQDEIAQIVHEARDFKSACQHLINLANERGGEDNITVVIAQFSGSALALPEPLQGEPQSLARSPDTPTEINWGGGGASDDQLNGQAVPVGDIMNAVEAGATQPLEAPPAQTAPFTSKVDPVTTELSRTTDPLNPRGPITAVFAPVDLNDDPNVSSLPSAKTEPFESHDTRPIHPQNSAAVPAQPPPISKAASDTEELTPGDKDPHSNQGGGRSRKGLFIAGFIALVLGGLAVGVTAHFRQQAQARADLQQAQIKIENQNQKDGRIGSLRDKIAELSKRLQASEKPSTKKKLNDMVDSLNRLSQRLDDVNKMSPDQLSEISQACDDIGKELSKIEEEVNSLLHGLLPPMETDRDPIKV